MNCLVWVCLLQAMWPQALGVYHEPSMTVIRPPKVLPEDAYFGYSITYYGVYKQLVVSAPTENNIGEVYVCDIAKDNKCNAIEKNLYRVSKNYTHDFWFGAAVKAGPDFVMMCAPRNVSYVSKYSEIGEHGSCYEYRDGKLLPTMAINEDARFEDSPNVFERTMDSFGWSIDVAADDSIIVGGPGMHTGRAMIYSNPRSIPKFISLQNIEKSVKFNFGYAVTAGCFVNTKISYAVGSTYGLKGYGKVLFFQDIKSQNTRQDKDRPENKKEGEQVGSMYGGVLCGAKLTGTPKRNDLLVGAPTYAEKNKYNLGAVYVYIAKKLGFETELTRKIVGQKSGGLFGSAIITLGDLNGDKKDEIAISAPFEEDGRGVVYLYSGADLISAKTEKTLTWLQRITPEPTTDYAKSFGLSLTSLLDYDENGCNELAIGSPFTNAVTLLRCMAAVTVRSYTRFPTTEMQNRSKANKTDFTFQACLEVEYPRKPDKIIATIETTVYMIHTDAKLTMDKDNKPYTFQTSLDTKQPIYCQDVRFTLPVSGNYELEINVKLSSKLLDDPRNHTTFEASRVLLTDRSELDVRESVWAAECSGDRDCVPDLTLQTQFTFHDGYLIGSTEKESFDIIFSNNGEVAYESCVEIDIEGAPVFQVPQMCEITYHTDFVNTIVCKPKPIRNNMQTNTGAITLDMNQLTSEHTKVVIKLHLYNRCMYKTPKDFTYTVTMKGDPRGVDIIGKTDIGEPVNLLTSDIEDGKHIEHVYKIINNGITHWNSLSAQVTLQKLSYINETVPVVHIGSSHVECESLKNDKKEYKYFLCTIPELPSSKSKASQEVQIRVPMNIIPGSLDGVIDQDNNVTLSSNITLIFHDAERTTIKGSVTSTLHLKVAVVDWWIFLVAGLFGLFIVIIIAFALYECGFLRRKNREDLKELQKSVKRQTIRRSMMQPININVDGDRNNILERMEEEPVEDSNKTS